MKDRIILLLFIIGLFLSLLTIEKLVPSPYSVFLIMGFIGLYFFLIQLAQYNRKRSVDRIDKFYPHMNLSENTEENLIRAGYPIRKKNFFKLVRSIIKQFKNVEDYKPIISIVIPCHNEEVVIEETLLELLKLDYPSYEIWAIDDRSTDNTAKILKDFDKKYPNKINYHIRPQDAFPGKSAVLNESMDMTKGEIICVFDADAKVNTDFLTRIIPYLANKEVGAVQARKVISNRNFNMLTRCQDNEYALDTHFQVGRDAIKGAVELRGNGQLIKREALENINGWNNNTITDDLDLSTKLHLKNWDIRFCPNVKVYEEGITSLWPLFRQRRRWVEGSIRRYLDYFVEVVSSREVSFRVSLDMCAYIAEFILPLWVMTELGLQSIKVVNGADQNLLISFAILPIVCVFFVSALTYGLKKHNQLDLKNSFIQAIETTIYTVCIWSPIVTFIVFKIIFKKRSMEWGKTVHGNITENKAIEEVVET